MCCLTEDLSLFPISRAQWLPSPATPAPGDLTPSPGLTHSQTHNTKQEINLSNNIFRSTLRIFWKQNTQAFKRGKANSRTIGHRNRLHKSGPRPEVSDGDRWLHCQQGCHNGAGDKGFFFDGDQLQWLWTLASEQLILCQSLNLPKCVTFKILLTKDWVSLIHWVIIF